MANTVFETEWRILYEILASVETSFIEKYIFISRIEQFRELLLINPSAAAELYWVEILGRAYLASATGLMRTRQWLRGIRSSISQSCYLSFVASLRGLLESTADQFYSLRDVPKTLAENYGMICEQLDGISVEGAICFCEELEDLLIHFYHAKRPKKHEEVPKPHKALRSADYLESLQGSSTGPIIDLYRKLCEVLHPAQGSLAPFAVEDPEGGYTIKRNDEKESINDFCATHLEAIRQMTAGINCCLLTLKVLNEFPMKDLHTASLGQSTEIVGWPTLRALIEKQRS